MRAPLILAQSGLASVRSVMALLVSLLALSTAYAVKPDLTSKCLSVGLHLPKNSGCELAQYATRSVTIFPGNSVVNVLTSEPGAPHGWKGHKIVKARPSLSQFQPRRAFN
jgi:hypothetical protein